jgi:aminoglycoside phosphotransferase family enzyme/predicted kinase
MKSVQPGYVPAASDRTHLVAAMLQPAFYSHGPADVIHKETHISDVFLAGDLVYKLKKPVAFSFLDFSRLSLRRHFLHEELRLNRRLAPTVYLQVLPITFDGDGWHLGDGRNPIEYALLMRRLPENRMLSSLLKNGRVTPRQMWDLADHLARFHAAATAAPGTEPDAYWATLHTQWRDNLHELKPLLKSRRDEAALEALIRTGSEFLNSNRDLFRRRVSQGWIRDVHGDLHAEHVCFAADGIQVFDCIEFNAELRCCDLASEVAFLLMDLAVRGGESLISSFLTPYLESLRDAEFTRLLPYYQSYRALVRAKVNGLRLGQWNEDAARYFSYAQRFMWLHFQPFILLIAGLTGSGKSTLARDLSARLGMALINSDHVRKRLAGNRARQEVPVNEGIYSPSMTELTYRRMAEEAEAELSREHGVIIDASFGRRSHRETFARLAAKHHVPLLVLHCSAADAETAERLRRRAETGSDISDGRWEVYLAQKASSEPLDEFSPSVMLELPTDAGIEAAGAEAEAFLHAALERSRR